MLFLPYVIFIRINDKAGEDNIVDSPVIRLILHIGNVMLNKMPLRMCNFSPLIV